jgi:flavin prenyltransferase
MEPKERGSGPVRNVIVGITGASGAIYGIRTLEILRSMPDIRTHLVLTASAARTVVEETDYSVADVRSLADEVHHAKDIGASISSGSFRTAGMLVAPCSIKTLSAVANCYADELVARAADVCLKERRRVVLLLRETPLHAGHIQMMADATRNGAIVMPPVPAFYHRPVTLDDIVNHTIGRALDLLHIELPGLKRWNGGQRNDAGSARDTAALAQLQDDPSGAGRP